MSQEYEPGFFSAWILVVLIMFVFFIVGDILFHLFGVTQ